MKLYHDLGLLPAYFSLPLQMWLMKTQSSRDAGSHTISQTRLSFSKVDIGILVARASWISGALMFL